MYLESHEKTAKNVSQNSPPGVRDRTRDLQNGKIRRSVLDVQGICINTQECTKKFGRDSLSATLQLKTA